VLFNESLKRVKGSLEFWAVHTFEVWGWDLKFGKGKDDRWIIEALVY
jgi:hypothetical protein